MRSLLLVLAATPAIAQFDPQAFRSPDGTFVLEVNPSHREGAGPADLVFHRRGEVWWRGESPVTPYDVSLDDTGRVLAVGYTKGSAAYGGDLVVFLLDPSGHELFRRTFPRRVRHLHSYAQPYCAGVPLFLEGERGLVRLVPGAAGRGVGDPRPQSPSRARVLGERALHRPPSTSPLQHPCDVRVGPDGRIHVGDLQNGSIHVFDAAGRWLHRCVPEEGDRRHPMLLDVAVDHEGHVLVNIQRRRFAEYDTLGQRVSSHDVVGRRPTFDRHGVGWVDAWDEVVTFDRSEHRRRRADGRWFRNVDAHALAPDGTLAVADSPQWSPPDLDPAYTIFEPDGEARVTYPVDFGDEELVRGLGWAACGGSNEDLRLLDERTGEVFRIDLGKGSGWQRLHLIVPPDHGELWIYSPKRHSVRRLAWPTREAR